MNSRTWLLVVLALASMAHYIHAQANLQSQQLAAAEAKWAELGATSYKYKLRVGGVFGAGEYRVEVRGKNCRYRHVGGIGLGHARFLERFRSEPTCNGRLIAELLKSVQTDVARGLTLTDVGVDARYGFLTKAYLDTSKIEDQGWGFEIMDFEVLGAGREGT
jgi:Family of unknown function (DUF6174)